MEKKDQLGLALLNKKNDGALSMCCCANRGSQHSAQKLVHWQE